MVTDWKKLLSSLGICYLVAFLGSVVTFPAITGWYTTLQKPGFTPPNWVFGPVWTLLYTLMAVALYLVWVKKTKNDKKLATNLFYLQLVLNLLWSVVFFGGHSLTLGLAVIVLLWLSVGATLVGFKKLSLAAVGLLVPYFLWVSFAAALNLSLIFLN